MKIRIGIVEDDPLVVEELVAITRHSAVVECCMSAHSAEIFLKYFRGGLDIVLLDIGLPGMSGAEAIPKILARAPETQIIMLTSFEDQETIFHALRCGASGYLLKDASLSGIEQIIKDVQGGIPALSPSVARKIIGYFNQKKQTGLQEPLSPKEMQVLNLLMEGLSYKQIAQELILSINGIRYHVKNIYRKLHINSRAELFQLYRDGKIMLSEE